MSATAVVSLRLGTLPCQDFEGGTPELEVEEHRDVPNSESIDMKVGGGYLDHQPGKLGYSPTKGICGSGFDIVAS